MAISIVAGWFPPLGLTALTRHRNDRDEQSSPIRLFETDARELTLACLYHRILLPGESKTYAPHSEWELCSSRGLRGHHQKDLKSQSLAGKMITAGM